MQKTAVLTICSRNYLGQALTLKQSVIKQNTNFDFYLYLADEAGNVQLPQVVLLSDDIVPNWKILAFKYDVIEFNTCIKPFCIEHLFNQGYENVMYIDPDIYLFNSLDSIVEDLNTYSVVLTPHRIEMMREITGFVTDVQISQNGIYNLGFIAIKNNNIGRRIIEWWKERLANYCYNEAREGLAVDQKWMDFIPGYFPNDTLISHDPGLNVAVWNIVEREITYKDGVPYVNIKGSEEKSTLKFFHFSGFSPEKKTRLDKRSEASDNKDMPSLAPLMEEYCQAELDNDFFGYKKYPYTFNFFEDGTLILPLNRRLYRAHEDAWKSMGDPFKTDGEVYKIFKSKGLLSKNKPLSTSLASHSTGNAPAAHPIGKARKVMLLALKIFGVDRYQRILRGFCGNLAKFENNGFLLD